jgi:ubiquinone/menaquinone biosynthesis C-methylase UbiE
MGVWRVRRSSPVATSLFIAPPDASGSRKPAGERQSPPATGSYQSKEWYQDKEVATTYEARRFRSPVGKFVDAREKQAFARALEGLPPGASVLELACGTGRMTRVLLERRFRTLGTDISLPMMSHARAALVRMDASRGFVRCDAAALPFKDGSFDVVAGFRFVPHLPSQVRHEVLRESARVSRDTVIFSAQSPWCAKYVYRRIAKAGAWAVPPCDFSPRKFGREASVYSLRLEATFRVLPLVAETYVARFQARHTDAMPGAFPPRDPRNP